MFNFKEDMHVHSTFSDGAGTLEENIRAAERQGLERLCCVDHVRRKTPWVPEFVKAVQQARQNTGIELLCGVEAKILNEDGDLDAPDDLTGVDYIYAADHRFPLYDKCRSPNRIRQMLADGEVTVERLMQALTNATCGAMIRHERVVVAHLFSILPKVGLSEAQVPMHMLETLAETAAQTGSIIDIDQRWSCPGPRSVEPFVRRGVRVLMSTDSHKPEDIGHYKHNIEVARTLGLIPALEQVA